MKRFLLGALLALVSSYAIAEEPQVDVAEVMRRGDMVVVAGEGPRSAETDAFLLAMAPPPDDSHKWFVTVFTQARCAPCEALKRDFRTHPELAAFVHAQEEARAWAHYNVYAREDGSQKKRIEQYRIAGYPTIVIQPPRNGMWGDPSVVVFQKTGYDGDPAALAKEIRDTVQRFTAAMSKRGYPRHDGGFGQDEGIGQEGAIGQGGADLGTPFQPRPREPEPQPYAPYAPFPQTYPPPEQSPITIPHIPGTGTTGLLLTVLANLGLNLFFLYREFRKKNDQPLVIPDSTLNPVVEFFNDLKDLLNQQKNEKA